MERKQEKRKKHRIKEERATQKVEKSFAFPLSPLATGLLLKKRKKRERNTDSHTYVEKAQFYN